MVCIFILLLYIWFNTDVADTHLIPTRRHTEIGTMVLLGIQRWSNYFFLLPLIKQSLFDLKLACWVKLHLYLKTDVGSFYGFFFPPSVQVHFYKAENTILPSLGLQSFDPLVTVCSGMGRPVYVLQLMEKMWLWRNLRPSFFLRHLITCRGSSASFKYDMAEWLNQLNIYFLDLKQGEILEQHGSEISGSDIFIRQRWTQLLRIYFLLWRRKSSSVLYV